MAELDEDYYKSLYKYKKENSKLNAKIKSSDNIQNVHEWLRRVEDASERAINSTFNPKSDTKQPQNKTRSNLNLLNAVEKKNLVDIQTEIYKKQDPYTEAHDLINGWMADKIRLDMDDDIFNYIDLNEMNQFASNEKEMDKLKSELLFNDHEGEEAALDMDILAIKGVDYDKYDEEYLTKDIMKKIMKKKIIDPKKLASETTTATSDNKPKFSDTRLKIELRHQAVKENREKRRREVEEKRREKLEKKEIELKAKMLVQKEEQDKRMREEIEKQLIEQEAQKLRLEMAEKRFRDEEMRKKIREMEQLRLKREKQDMSNIQRKLELSQLDNEIELKKNEIAQKRAEDLAESYLKTKNLKKMRKIFSSWYGLILEMRLKTGKAKALADWKLSSKVFNAWKKSNITEKVKKEQELYKYVVKNENIKNSQATNFYNRKLVKKLFDEWKNYTKNQLVTKQIESERVVAKSRMQKFLEAVAEGKINNDEDLKRSKSFEELDNSAVQLASTRTIKSANKSSSKSRISSRSDRSHHQQKQRTNRSDSIDNNLSNLETSKYSENELNKKVKDAMWPWVKTPFNIASNFDNRFKAQEKLLHEQTKMIKEQQKLIEDMKYQQSQIAFKEQIALLEQIKAKQLELESMQKSQYKQEKELLRKKAEILRIQQNQSSSKRPSTVSLAENTNSNSEVEKNETVDLTTTRTEERNETFQSDTNRSKATSDGRKINQFVVNMEERAKMREQMKREREEKRKKQEMEKLELLKAQQEEKMRIEEEEKRIKAAELKEKKRIHDKLEEKRNMERVKEQQALEKADNFYKKYLLRYYGMNGLKKLLEMRKAKLDKAIRYDSVKVCARIFVSWRIMARSEASVNERIADEFYAKLLLRNYYFNGVKLFKQSLQIEMAKAGRFYRYNIKLKLFNCWREYTKTEKKKSVENEAIVESHNLKRIKAKYFKEWREFPEEMKRMRARQKRLEDLRSRVKEIVPDFEPPSSINSSTKD